MKSKRTVGIDGTIYWRIDINTFHRLDGPAIENPNGSKFWFIHGKQHRIGAPAVEYTDGTKFWYVNGLRHRIDGPAIEWVDGTKAWYVNGEVCTEQQFIEWQETQRTIKQGSKDAGMNVDF